MLGMITGALVAMVIDFLLKEGQGLGASGPPGPHRRVRLEQHRPRPDRRAARRRLQAEGRGPRRRRQEPGRATASTSSAATPTDADDLERAGIADASAALVFPVDGSDEPDMHSILTIMAIKSVAPDGPDRRRGQQPAPRAALPAGRGGRAAGHLQGGLAPARPLGALPGPVGDRDRHRVGRRGLRAVPDHPARRVPRAVDRHGRPRGCAAITRPRCCRSTAAGARSSTRRATSCSRPGDDAIVVAESLGTLAPLKLSDLHTAAGTLAPRDLDLARARPCVAAPRGRSDSRLPAQPSRPGQPASGLKR